MTDNNPRIQAAPSQTGEDAAASETGAGGNRRVANWMFFGLAASLVAAAAYFKHAPQSASAAQVGPGATGTSFDESLAAELAAFKSVDRALNGTEAIINDFKFAPARVQVPLTSLNVNPFRATGASALPIDLQDDSALHDQHEQERQSAMQALQSLKLQSITHGATKRACMINSVRYQEGQEAGGFLVEEIASNMVVVRKGAYRFELKPSM